MKQTYTKTPQITEHKLHFLINFNLTKNKYNFLEQGSRQIINDEAVQGNLWRGFMTGY